MGFNDNQNKRITNFITDELGLNPRTDNIPKQVIPAIQPTFEVNQKFSSFLVASGSSGTSATTLTTTSSTKDTYLTGLTFSYAKDATCDIASGTLSVSTTISGTAVNIIRVAVLTLTAQDGLVSYSLPTPLKIDRGTTITIAANSFTAGSLIKACTLIGYTQDTGDVTPA